MRIPKDLWNLLLHKYFDTLTIYHCQFVSKETNAEVKKDLHRLKIARTERHAQHLKEKQKEFVNKEYLYNARKRISSTICNKNERKKELQKILKSLYFCRACGRIHSSSDSIEQEICYTYCLERTSCRDCMSIYPDLDGSPHKTNYCPLYFVKCGDVRIFNKFIEPQSSRYRFWSEHPKIKGVAISDCSFIGCIAEYKQHFKECSRKCLGCEETFLLENIQKHLKKCFPHLIITGLLDDRLYYLSNF